MVPAVASVPSTATEGGSVCTLTDWVGSWPRALDAAGRLECVGLEDFSAVGVGSYWTRLDRGFRLGNSPPGDGDLDVAGTGSTFLNVIVHPTSSPAKTVDRFHSTETLIFDMDTASELDEPDAHVCLKSSLIYALHVRSSIMQLGLIATLSPASVAWQEARRVGNGVRKLAS
jgi:hypothetical protein